MATPSQSAKLNVHQSVLVAKLPNLMSAEYIAPTPVTNITVGH